MIGWLGLLVINIGLALLQRLLAPRLPRRKSAPFESPTTEDGAPITKGFGIYQVAGVTTLVRDSHKTDQGEVTFYFAKMDIALGYGPADVLFDIISDERSLKLQVPRTNQSIDGNDPLIIDPPLGAGLGLTGDAPLVLDVAARQMFGGQLQEGGLQGQIRLYRGTDNQPIDPLLVVDQGVDASAYPHLIHAVFGTAVGEPTTSQLADDFYWIANSATPKPIAFILGSYPDALLNDGGRIGFNANPAEMLYELFTNRVWGKGELTSSFDVVQWTTKALQLKAEGSGLSGLFADRTLDDIKDDILSHIDGEVVQDPLTGLHQLKLARPDYDVGDLFVVTANNSRDFRQGEAQFSQTLSEVKVKYQRFEGGGSGPQTQQVGLPWPPIPPPPEGVPPPWNPPPGAYTFVWETAARNLTDISATVTRDGITRVLRTGGSYLGRDYDVDPASGVFHFYHWLDGNNPDTISAGDIVEITFTAAPTFSGFVDTTATSQNLANRQIVGYTRSGSYDYPLFTTATVAQRKADLLRLTTSRKLAVYGWTGGRDQAHLTPLDVVLVNDVKYRTLGVPVRLTKVTVGDPTSGTVLIEGVEDVFGQPIQATFPTGTVVIGTPHETAPTMAIGCGAGDTQIRINLFASDPLFSIELWEANDEIGTGAVLLGTYAGSTTYVDVGTDATKAHRARMVRADVDPGLFTDWITCDIVTPPLPPTCTLPTWAIVQDLVAGTAELSPVDPDHRMQEVRIAVKSGVQAQTPFAIATAPYIGTVVLVAGLDSFVYFEIDYQDCAGLLQTSLETAVFPGYPVIPPPELPPVGLTTVHNVITFITGAVPVGIREIPGEATFVTSWGGTSKQLDASGVTSAYLGLSVLYSTAPVGAFAVVRYEDPDVPGSWLPLDGVEGPMVAIDSASLDLLDPDKDGDPWVVMGPSVGVLDLAAQAGLRYALFIGGGADIDDVILAEASLHTTNLAPDLGPEEPRNPPPPNPDGCDFGNVIASGLTTLAQFTDAWTKDTQGGAVTCTPSLGTYQGEPVLFLDMYAGIYPNGTHEYFYKDFAGTTTGGTAYFEMVAAVIANGLSGYALTYSGIGVQGNGNDYYFGIGPAGTAPYNQPTVFQTFITQVVPSLAGTMRCKVGNFAVDTNGAAYHGQRFAIRSLKLVTSNCDPQGGGSGLGGNGGPGIDPIPPLPPPPAGTGAPMGAFNLPADGLGYWNGAIIYVTPANIGWQIAKARAAGTYVFVQFGGSNSDWKINVNGGDGLFVYDLWQATVDAIYNNATAKAALDAGIADGTVFAAFPIDEPFQRNARYGGTIPYATVERMMVYIKSKWPTLRTTTTIDLVQQSWYATRHMNGLDSFASDYMLVRGDCNTWVDACIARSTALGHGPPMLAPHYRHFNAVTNGRIITVAEFAHYGPIIHKVGTLASLGWRYDATILAQPGWTAEWGRQRAIFDANHP